MAVTAGSRGVAFLIVWGLGMAWAAKQKSYRKQMQAHFARFAISEGY